MSANSNSTKILGNLVTGTTGSTNSNLVYSTSPTLITPILGVASATTLNKLTLTAPATGSTITIADTKIFTINNTLTFSGTDSSSISFGSGGTVLYGNQTITLSGDITGSGATSITTTVAKILGVTVSGTTGTGNVVFSTSPTLSTAILGSSTATTQTPGDNSTKLATTAYVDSAVLGQNFKEAVKYASIAALPSVVYANGSSGVGATLTGVALAAISLDSSSPGVGDRVLIKNQVSSFQNGIYTVTQTGSGIAVFILTRTTDSNQTQEFKTGDSVFVTAGSTLSTTTWAYNGIDSPVIGTDAITFTQTAGQGSFTAGNGISITGVSIAISSSPTITTATLSGNTTVTGDILQSTSKFLKSGGNLIIGGNGTNTLIRPATSSNQIQFQNFDGSSNFSIQDGGAMSGTSLTLTTALNIASGGTNSNSALNNNRILKSSGGAIIEAAAISANQVLISDANGIPIAGGAGTSGQVLTSNGASAPTFQAATGGSTPTVIITTTFETSGRFSSNVIGGGSNTFGTNGLVADTSSTITSGAGVVWNIDQNGNPDAGNPTFSTSINFSNIGTDMKSFFGIGNISTNFTYTVQHYGFKVIRTASGAINLFATQADGSTETASSSLTTINAGDQVDLILVIKSGTNCSYYFRQNGGALSSANVLTTNLPATTGNAIQLALSNAGVATQNTVRIRGASYQR